MTSRSEIERMIAAADRADGVVCLATVVDVDGSAYRRPGARMLVLPGAEAIGSISGGCLERDLCRAAIELTAQGPKVVTFDTRADLAGSNKRYDLGCAGIIHVLVERVTEGMDGPLGALRRTLESDRPCVVATVYRSDGDGGPAIGTRVFASSEAPADGGTAALREALAGAFDDVGASGRACNVEIVEGEKDCRLLVERVDPPRPFWIFGAGHDAEPLCAMAAELGWRVTVVDKRAERLVADRFPGAANRVCVDPGDLTRRLEPNERTAAVVITHDFADDQVVVPWLLENGVGYVGLLGPKSRTARLAASWHAAGRHRVLAALDRLHSPVGLDLGGSTPAAIAVSILAEIVAVDHGRDGGALGDRSGAIHEPAAHRIVVRDPVSGEFE